MGDAVAEHLGLARGASFRETEQVDAAVAALIAENASGGIVDARRRARAVLSGASATAFADHSARQTVEEFGEKQTEASSVDHRALPSVWARAIIHTARAYAVIVGGTSPNGNRSPKFVDLTHLGEAAAYADVFVSSDRPLRAFAQTVRGLRCEVLDYKEWAARFT
jgi:hypothetical protein